MNGVHRFVQCNRVLKFWWIYPACRADRLCAQERGSNLVPGTRTAFALYRYGKHQDRDTITDFGTLSDPYYDDVNGTAYQQGTVGPFLKRMGRLGLWPQSAQPELERDYHHGNILEDHTLIGQPVSAWP